MHGSVHRLYSRLLTSRGAGGAPSGPRQTCTGGCAFLRAAGLDSEFRQATTGTGEPTDNGVREVLLDFYARNHPEYANEEKVARIIRSFRRKAQVGPAVFPVQPLIAF